MRHAVLVGAGQVTRRPGEGAPPSPLELMEAATSAALADADADLAGRIGSVIVVDSLSWPAGDPGAVLAARMGLSPAETVRTGMGGNSPGAAVIDAAARIADGSLDAALIVGAEAMATLMPYAKRGLPAPWGAPSGGTPARVLAGDDGSAASAAEQAAGLIAPIMFYPLFEHALRRASGRSVVEHIQQVSALWARFSAVAAANPYAWTQEAVSTATIATPSDDNRRVSDPYTKLMNSNLAVDQGAALLLCGADVARAAGVPADRWVYVHAAAQANDHWFASVREELHRSPALAACGRAALEHAGVAAADHVELYSCFPSAVQIAADALGIDLTQTTPTVTGGLSFAGGPGNNYATHGIAALAERLRADPGSFGIATALGWYVTKHAVGVYSTAEPERPFVAVPVQESVDRLPRRGVAEDYSGPAAVEAYTALFERDGTAGIGIVAARLTDGRRALASSQDAGVLAELLGGEDPLGRPLDLRGAASFTLG